MIELDPGRFKTKPFKHQIDGIKELIYKPAFALFDEMGSGKSAQVINAACLLFEDRQIDCVLVVAPASVRSVWLNPKYGEILKHCWVPSLVGEYHQKSKIIWETPGDRQLTWLVTNYEYVRPLDLDDSRRDQLAMMLENFKSVMLVLDESSAVKSNRSKQYEAIRLLRKKCTRCVILNGTPVPNNPLDLWAQLDVMDHDVLGRHYKNFFHFRYSHCLFGGWRNKQIIGWNNLEKVQDVIKPFCLRRKKRDCLDLPEKFGGIEGTPITREVPLKEETWRMYKRLRTEAILAIPDREERLEANAAVRIMRLAQLTSGFTMVPGAQPASPQAELWVEPECHDLSEEKLTWTTDYLKEWSQAEASIVWCRWRRERERLVKMLREKDFTVYEMYGGQNPIEREAAKVAFNPASRGTGRRILVAQPHAGGKGLDLCAATESLYQSNDHSLEYRLQSEDRNHRSGTIENVLYIEVLATGPKGQQTIDHTILNALQEKQTLASWTCARWRKALLAEEEQG
jgi:SNF2 family DNA or RNA helicase